MEISDSHLTESIAITELLYGTKVEALIHQNEPLESIQTELTTIVQKEIFENTF